MITKIPVCDLDLDGQQLKSVLPWVTCTREGVSCPTSSPEEIELSLALPDAFYIATHCDHFRLLFCSFSCYILLVFAFAVFYGPENLSCLGNT